MEKKKLQQELDVLLSHQLFNDFMDYDAVVAWSYSLMERGYQTPYLDMLAGMDSSDISDHYHIELYLERLAEELQLKWITDTKELFQAYTAAIAQFVIDGALEASIGLQKLEKLWLFWPEEDELSDSIIQFYFLSEDRCMDEFICYGGLTEENVDEVIRQEMELYLLMLKLGWHDVSRLVYCKHCQAFRNMVNREGKNFLSPDAWYCEMCRSAEILDWYVVANRTEMLEYLRVKCQAI